jgi:hypothetical protein
MVVTPLAALWFDQIAALPASLVAPAKGALWFSILLPALTVLQSWHQGVLMHERRTRGITEAMLLALLSHAGVLLLGVLWQGLPGLYIGVLGLMVGNLARSAWLWYRTRNAMQTLRHRDLALATAAD